MDEASKIIAELQQRLAKLDHKIWLYRQDMASEFKKYADSLLRDVPDEVSNTVKKAIAESLKSYQSLDLGNNDSERPCSAVNMETMANYSPEVTRTPPKTVQMPPVSSQGLESPDAPQNLHEREKEFQGLFTPSYLPLLDSTDRNERRSSSGALSPASETEAMNILVRERSTPDTGARSSSYPTTPQSFDKPAALRRRSTDEGSVHSDHSDAPTRRSALRRKSNDSKPQSPRHVRFEFEGEEFPTTSTEKLEPRSAEPSPPREPIILGFHDEMPYDGGSDRLVDTEDSPPPKRISSSQALRLLSRGPLEDDGTQWTEVRAPKDGSASIAGGDTATEGSDGEDGISMQPLSVTAAARRSNGRSHRLSSPWVVPKSDPAESPPEPISQSAERAVSNSNGGKTDEEIAEEEDMLSELPPLQLMGPLKSTSAGSSTERESKYTDKSQTVATKPSKGVQILPEKQILNHYSKSSTGLKLKADDRSDEDDDLFTFDEAAERPHQYLEPEPESESEPDSTMSDTGDESMVNPSQYATSPALGIQKSGMNTIHNSSTSNTTTTDTEPGTATSSSHRNSYHPFNTPIVSEAVHAQAASLGHVNTFVGSVKDGLDEDALQSFKAGSFRGGAPRSLSEKMAFDDAMEAQRKESRKR